MIAFNKKKEHLGSELMLDLIEGTIKDAGTRAWIIEHLADCDRCLAAFADWLRAVKPKSDHMRLIQIGNEPQRAQRKNKKSLCALRALCG